MTQSKEVIADWIAQIQEEGKGLTNWEEAFILSIQEQFELRGSISDRQEEILERIYAERT